jgi:hypothetical protein
MTEPFVPRPADRHQSPIWTDPERPLTERVHALLAVMTLEEKLAQLVGVWVGVSADTDAVAPTGDEGASSRDLRLEARIRLTGAPRVVGHDRVLHTPATVHAMTERVSRQSGR